MLAAIGGYYPLLTLEGVLFSDDLEFPRQDKIDTIHGVILFENKGTSYKWSLFQVVRDRKKWPWLFDPSEKPIKPSE